MSLQLEGIRYEFSDAGSHVYQPKSDNPQFMEWVGKYTRGTTTFRGTHVTSVKNICVFASHFGCLHLEDAEAVCNTTLKEVIDQLDGSASDTLKPEEYPAVLREMGIEFVEPEDLCPMMQALIQLQFHGRVIHDYAELILVSEADKLVAELRKVLVVAEQHNVEFFWN